LNHPLLPTKNFQFHRMVQQNIVSSAVSDLLDGVNQLAQYLQNQYPEVKVILSLLPNCPEWSLLDLTCLQYGYIHIPVNENISRSELAMILKDNEVDLVVVKKKRHIHLVESLSMNIELSILNIHDVPNQSAITPPKQINYDAQAPAVVLYTSGSSALMKGIQHSHQSLTTAIQLFAKVLEPLMAKKALTYLPLSFSGERKLHYSYQHLGIDICYAALSKSLLDNLLLFKPDIMAMVPSVLEKLIDKLEVTDAEISLKYIVCGGASIKPMIKARYRAIGINVIEVYGLTETASIGTANLNSQKDGSCGRVLQDVKIKINRQGEICLHTPTLLIEYVSHVPTLLEFNGIKYFNTGDKGYTDDEGYLFVTGRANNSIKLNNGTWLQPEEIEINLLKLAKGKFRHVIVVMIQSKLTAIIVSSLSNEKVQHIIDKFNENSFIYIEDIIVRNQSKIEKELSSLKFSRKELLASVLNQS